jgi:hypothetical protein
MSITTTYNNSSEIHLLHYPISRPGKCGVSYIDYALGLGKINQRRPFKFADRSIIRRALGTHRSTDITVLHSILSLNSNHRNDLQTCGSYDDGVFRLCSSIYGLNVYRQQICGGGHRLAKCFSRNLCYLYVRGFVAGSYSEHPHLYSILSPLSGRVLQVFVFRGICLIVTILIYIVPRV